MTHNSQGYVKVLPSRCQTGDLRSLDLVSGVGNLQVETFSPYLRACLNIIVPTRKRRRGLLWV